MALPTATDLEDCFQGVGAGAGDLAQLHIQKLRVFLRALLVAVDASADLTTKPGIAGALIISGNVAPADADLDANQMAIYFTPTNGAAALSIKAKQANGTVKTGTVAVTT